ncbi:tetratricopeptide repeat protein [Saccharopolyspora halophila]
MRLGALFRFVWYALLTGVAGWAATGAFSEGWKPWGPIVAAVAAGATGTFVGEAINARRKFVEDKRAHRQTLSEAQAHPAADLRSKAALLRPERAVVGFVGRKDELQQLKAWCGDESGSPSLLMVGAGGVGKTRLAKELTDTQSSRKWTCTSIKPEKSVVEAVNAAAATNKRQLLVIDYAETRTDLHAMLAELAAQEAAGKTGKLRVLLIARHAGEWWDDLRTTDSDATRSLVTRTSIMRLEPELDADHDNRRTIQEAMPYYAKALGRPTPDFEIGLAEAEPLPVLVLHTAALVAVLDDAEGTGSATLYADNGVLDRLLGHERALWKSSARQVGIAIRPLILEQVIAVITLIFDSSSDEAAVRDALRRVPELTDSDESTIRALESWLHQLYPGADHTVDRLRPDLVAERHAVTQMHAAPELRQTCFANLPDTQATQALTVLTRATSHHQRARDILAQVLRNNLPGLASPAISVAVRTGTILGDILASSAADAELSIDELRTLHAKIPNLTVALSTANAVVAQRICNSLPGETTSHEVSSWKTTFSVALAGNGRWEEALEAITEAVTIRRDLAKQRPETFLPDLAMALSNQSADLAVLGRREEALEASTESAKIYRNLATQHPDSFHADLAMALNNQANQMANLGRREEALQASTEAADINRELATQHPDAFLPDLATTLNTQSLQFASLGRRKESLEAITEAVTIRRDLAKERPDAFHSSLGGALSNQSIQLEYLRRNEEALEAITEAVNIFRDLTKQRPDAFLPDLATTLNNQLRPLALSGRREDALEAITEAVKIRRKLATQHPDVFNPDLAMSLNNHASLLAALGRREEALKAATEAVKIRRKLAAKWPYVFNDDLENSLALLRKIQEVDSQTNPHPPNQ